MNVIPLFNSDSLSAKRVVVFSVSRPQSRATIKQIKAFDQLYDDFIAAGIDEIICLTLNDNVLYNMFLPKLSSKIKFVSGLQEFKTFVNKHGNLEYLKLYWHFNCVIDNKVVMQYNTQTVTSKLPLDTVIDFYQEINPKLLLNSLTLKAN
jgi:peroxiredoxin